MVGKRLCSDLEATMRGFGSPECAQQRRVLRETLAAFEESGAADRCLRLASENVKRWRNAAEGKRICVARVAVMRGDWGDVTLSLTREYGTCFGPC